MIGWWRAVLELGGSIARQLAQAIWGQYINGAQWSCSVYKWGLAGTQEIFSCAFGKLCKICKLCEPVSSTSSMIATQELAAQSVFGWWEKLHCVSLVFHIIYYYYSVLCCLIKLPQPMGFTFCPFSSRSHCVGRNKWVLVAVCQVKPQQLIFFFFFTQLFTCT